MDRSLIDTILAAPNDQSRFEVLSEVASKKPGDAQRTGISLLTSPVAEERVLGADLLGQVATTDGPPDNLAGLLCAALQAETSAEVRSALITALGHARAEACRDQVLTYAFDADDSVRFAVAVALPSLGLESASIQGLESLSMDSAPEVRDWATFGLAESEHDSVDLPDALLARANDPDGDARAEAIYGLARRGDPRARALIERERSRPVVGSLILRALDELNSRETKLG